MLETGNRMSHVHPFEEFGDVEPALQLVLKTQSAYARSEPGTNRAMRDIAVKALYEEIRKYGRTVCVPTSDPADRLLQPGPQE